MDIFSILKSMENMKPWSQNYGSIFLETFMVESKDPNIVPKSKHELVLAKFLFDRGSNFGH